MNTFLFPRPCSLVLLHLTVQRVRSSNLQGKSPPPPPSPRFRAKCFLREGELFPSCFSFLFPAPKIILSIGPPGAVHKYLAGPLDGFFSGQKLPEIGPDGTRWEG